MYGAIMIQNDYLQVDRHKPSVYRNVQAKCHILDLSISHIIAPNKNID